jgi:cell division transport system ATP-binding protein
MDEKRVIELRDVAIYHAENPFGNYSAERMIQSGVLVLKGVNLSVDEGEFVYLIGRVGSGKSTLLKTLYAEVELLVGEGNVVGFDLRTLRRREIPYLRRKIGMVFQDYQLLTDRNVFQNLYYVMQATGTRSDAAIRKRIDEVLQLVGLEAKHYKMPFELSGGEQQRLVIARALLNRPRLLLADEPTGNLDPMTADGIMKLFREITKSGCAVVMSTHNTNLIEEYPARTILFEKGEVREIDMQALIQEAEEEA